MKKNWVIALSLLLASIGTLAAPPQSPANVTVDGAMRRQTIDALIAKLNGYYVFPEKAKQAATVLHERQRDGKYDGITDGAQLAQRLSDDLAEVIHDKHMRVGFDPRMVPPDPKMAQPPQSLAEFKKVVPPQMIEQILASNRGVEKVELVAPGIGYLALSGFLPPFLTDSKFAAAMDKLADTDAMIIDLRNNRGGAPEGVALLISYFVDERTRLNDIWNRETGVSTQYWTVDKLDGKRYGSRKPVLILTGPGTASAGEDFAYTMQALKRAMLIGERTWGGAHPTRPFRLNDHFFVAIPSMRSISPITHTNWEGSGVVPDVAAPADQALAIATETLQRKLKEKN